MTKKSLEERIKTQQKKISNLPTHLQKTDELLDEMLNEILKWREISNCTAPITLQYKLDKLEKQLQEKTEKSKDLETELKQWKKLIPYCSTIDKAQDFLTKKEFVAAKITPIEHIYNLYNTDFPGKLPHLHFDDIEDFNTERAIFVDFVNTKDPADLRALDAYCFIPFFKMLYETGVEDPLYDLVDIYGVIKNV